MLQLLYCMHFGLVQWRGVSESRQLRPDTNALSKYAFVCEPQTRSDTRVNALRKLHLIFHFVPLREELTKKCCANIGQYSTY